MSFAEKIFGTFSDRELKKINPLTKRCWHWNPNIRQCPTPTYRPRLRR